MNLPSQVTRSSYSATHTSTPTALEWTTNTQLGWTTNPNPSHFADNATHPVHLPCLGMDNNVPGSSHSSAQQDHPVAPVQLRDFNAVPVGQTVGPVEFATDPVDSYAVWSLQF